MTDHVTRAETQALFAELNEARRVLPIFRQALETIAGEHARDPHRVAHRALREADAQPD